MMEPKDFQTLYIEQKANRLLSERKIKFEGKFENKVRFKILPLSEKNHEHLVFLDLRTKEFHCDCRYSALHPERDCASIIAAKRWWEMASESHPK